MSLPVSDVHLGPKFRLEAVGRQVGCEIPDAFSCGVLCKVKETIRMVWATNWIFKVAFAAGRGTPIFLKDAAPKMMLKEGSVTQCFSS